MKSMSSEQSCFGEGMCLGPSHVMIDDSTMEGNVFTSVWSWHTLLHTFHFLLYRWTWLHDSKNGVQLKHWLLRR